ncbi:transporter substrate-binding domain-containing protein [Thetidibacter halocola]|uniref:Transporter substrate-binding domain-containing protein n=1 Tax=Thetidibacter halocola TaxID=2827239 RepID=A0A8J7WFW8_9RHOB|nr:transporter substrate-binding domain-containing protein [Thetidibacter halocola]MBS0124318.1 transporter substrate-binding domain-containing protein [Thetidibacter halocola]
MSLPQALLDDYAPTSVLRVALNHGNRVLVGRDADGKPIGIAVDLATALADLLGLPLRFVEFDRAVDVSSSAGDDLWDVCFLAVDPKRMETIDFTAPYIRIEGNYLSAPGTLAADAQELVDLGCRVGTVEGTAYTLALSRLPGAGNLVAYHDILAALEALDSGEVEAIAGIREAMEGESRKRPGSRILTPPFMEIRQAMAMPRGRALASAHLRETLADFARSGLVGDILERHGVSRDCALVG